MGVDATGGLAGCEGRFSRWWAEPLSELADTEREIHHADGDRIGRRQAHGRTETGVVEEGAGYRGDPAPQRRRKPVLQRHEARCRQPSPVLARGELSCLIAVEVVCGLGVALWEALDTHTPAELAVEQTRRGAFRIGQRAPPGALDEARGNHD